MTRSPASSCSRAGPSSGCWRSGSKLRSILERNRVAISSDASEARSTQISARWVSAASVRRSASGRLIASSRAR